MTLVLDLKYAKRKTFHKLTKQHLRRALKKKKLVLTFSSTTTNNCFKKAIPTYLKQMKHA